MQLPQDKRSHGVVQPVLLPIRRPLVVVRGHRANNTGLVREVQAAELAVLLHGVVPFLFENSVALMMDLMRQSETFG
jgi:hypothetical protein